MRRWWRRPSAPACRCCLRARCAPRTVYPPADPLQFCTTAFAANYDSRAALAFIKETAKEPVKTRLVGHGDSDFARRDRFRRAELSKTMGMTPVDKEIIPPPTPDYTPFATKIKDAGANWVYSWAPWVTQVRTLEALRRLDWKGDLHRLGPHRGGRRAGAPQGWQVLRRRRQRAVPGRPADPQGDRRRGQEGQRAISGRSRWRRAGSPAWWWRRR